MYVAGTHNIAVASNNNYDDNNSVFGTEHNLLRSLRTYMYYSHFFSIVN